MTKPMKTNDLEDLEIKLLLEAVYYYCGYDFRDYAYASLKRRIKKRMQDGKLDSVSALQHKVLHDAGCLERLLNDLSIHVTSLFRYPSCYLALRQKVVPLLRTYRSFASGSRAVRLARKFTLWRSFFPRKVYMKNAGFMPPILMKRCAGLPGQGKVECRASGAIPSLCHRASAASAGAGPGAGKT